MAILNNGIPTNITEYPNSFKRQGAFPLEAYSVFYDTYNNDILTKSALDNAKDYAKNNKVAYVGQQLITVSQGTIRLFVIANETGELVEYVKQNDYATKDKGGTVKINPNYGLKMIFGSLMGTTKTGNSYTKADDDCLISKGTLNPLLNNKQDTLVSGTNIKTINGQNILGSGNITISGGEGGSALPPLFVTETDGVASHNAIQIYEYAQQGGQVYFHDCALTNISETYVTFLSTSTEEGIHYEYNIDENGEVDYYERIYADINYVNNKLNDITDPILETSATNKRYVDNAINDVRATAAALNGKKEVEFNYYLSLGDLNDIATYDRIEITSLEGDEDIPDTIYVIPDINQLDKYHIMTSNIIPIIEVYDPDDRTTTSISLDNRYYYCTTDSNMFTINGVKINPDNRQADIFVFVTDIWENGNLTYSVDAYTSEELFGVRYFNYNTSKGNYPISTDVVFSPNTIICSGKWYSDGEMVIRYLQKSNIENSIGDRSLTQTFDPGYTYVKIASKNPLVDELKLGLTDTTPIGATGDWASSFGGVSAAMGKRSFACGTNTVAKGKYSLASGDNSIAYGNDSFTSGLNNVAKGSQSATFGSNNAAIGQQSFTIGGGCKARGGQSFAGGQNSETYGDALRSFAFGDHCKAYFNDQFVVGRFNGPLPYNTLFAVGTGTEDSPKTMFEVTDTGAKVNGQYVLRTSDLTTAKSELNDKIDSISGKISKSGPIIHLENMCQTNLVTLTNFSANDNHCFTENVLTQSTTVTLPRKAEFFYYDIKTVGTSVGKVTQSAKSEQPSSKYRYILVKTAPEFTSPITHITLSVDGGLIGTWDLPVTNIQPNTEYIIVLECEPQEWKCLYIFNWTSRSDWANDTADYHNVITPNCYIMTHRSQLSETRGNITATWYTNDQYTLLENRIKVLEKDLTTLIKFFKDSDTDGVLPPFTLGG